MPFSQKAPARIQPYFGYRSSKALTLTARALASGKRGFKTGGRWQAIRTMLAQFASREVAGLPVILTICRPDGTAITCEKITNEEGFVRFDIPLDGNWPLPNQTSWEVASLQWDNADGRQIIDAHILAPGNRVCMGVISDIDDTVIETGITGNLRAIARNWRRVLMQMPDERIAVPGVDGFYNALGGGTVLRDGEEHTGQSIDATHHPFFYVSSSPWNLYSYLVAFMQHRGIPLGPIHLRDWGFDRQTLGSGSHGAHKIDAIEGLFAKYPELRFALVGDDTQGDLTAFGKLAAHHADRIAAIFIRTAGMEDFSPEEVAAKAVIQAAGIPLWLGNDYATGQAFLKAAGLHRAKEARQLMHTIDEGPEPMAA